MLWNAADKPIRRVVGMMSGTSVDGIDAALVELRGPAEKPELTLLAFENRPFLAGRRGALAELVASLYESDSVTLSDLEELRVFLDQAIAAGEEKT